MLFRMMRILCLAVNGLLIVRKDADYKALVHGVPGIDILILLLTNPLADTRFWSKMSNDIRFQKRIVQK